MSSLCLADAWSNIGEACRDGGRVASCSLLERLASPAKEPSGLALPEHGPSGDAIEPAGRPRGTDMAVELAATGSLLQDVLIGNAEGESHSVLLGNTGMSCLGGNPPT